MQKRFLSTSIVIALALVLVAGLTLGSVRPVQAADIRNTGVLPAGETVDDDLILSGQQVRVDGTVNGMLVAAGQTVTLNGTINGDAVLMGENIIVGDQAVINGNLFTGARTVVVNGQITGSIAAGSATLVTGAKVGRNIYYGGYSLQTDASSTVARGLYFGGYQAVLNGAVARELNAGAGALEINGEIGGNAVVRVSAPGQRQPRWWAPADYQLPASLPTGLRVGPNAKIAGKLTYISDAAQSSAIQAQPAGGVVYQTPPPDQRTPRTTPQPAPGFNPLKWFFDLTRNFITLLLLGLLAVWLIPAIAGRTSQIARTQFLPSAGYGLLAVIVGYIGAFMVGVLIFALGLFLSILTLGGLSSAVFGIGFSGLSAAVAAFTLVVSYVSKLVIAYLIGEVILSGASPTMQGRRYLAMVIGVAIYAIARSIPFIGWMVGLLVTVAGVGAIYLYLRSLRAKQPPAEMIPAA